jgi:hypothetical protein
VLSLRRHGAGSSTRLAASNGSKKRVLGQLQHKKDFSSFHANIFAKSVDYYLF